MNVQRFIIPATVAAAFHAALFLYGKDTVIVPPLVVEKTPPGKEIPPEDRLFEIPLEKDPFDEPQPEVKAIAQGVELPSIEEVITDRTSEFRVETEPTNPTKVTVPVTTIGPIGSPEGLPGVPTIKASFFSSDHLDKVPQSTVRMSPAYPSAMKASGIEGVVMVEFEVDTKGRVVSARVRQSSDRAFEEPTLRAVLNWRFEPGRKDGRPVPFRMVIPVHFNLGET